MQYDMKPLPTCVQCCTVLANASLLQVLSLTSDGVEARAAVGAGDVMLATGSADHAVIVWRVQLYETDAPWLQEACLLVRHQVSLALERAHACDVPPLATLISSNVSTFRCFQGVLLR